MFSAKVIEHSITTTGIELITMEWRYVKILDAEISRHRMFSHSASSDRAMPSAKITSLPPFIPEDLRMNEPGMQGYTHATDDEHLRFEKASLELYKKAVQTVSNLKDFHKQHINRFLLPWSWQKRVTTANKEQYEYFFSLRDSEDADPAIQLAAKCAKYALQESTPKLLNPAQWHLPYINNSRLDIETALECSVSRCARTSYNNHDGTQSTISKDVDLFDRLIEMKHWSVLEHQATPMQIDKIEAENFIKDFICGQAGITHVDRELNLWSGNFKGFIQYRKLMENEKSCQRLYK